MSANRQINRRTFLAGVGQTTVAAGLASTLVSCAKAVENTVEGAGTQKSGIKKSLKYEMIKSSGSMLDKFKLVKEVGFDGVELSSPNDYKVEEVIAARDASGLVINGVVDGAWKVPFTSPDPEVRKQALKDLETALRDAKAYGATSVLLVPGVVSKEVSYADAYKRAQEGIRQAVPLAKELNVYIAIENVWNNFLLSPLEAARFIDEFESPMVRQHFDVGNVLRYGWPDQWIQILNKRIFKLDIKEYSKKLENAKGPWKGFDCEIGSGDIDWAAVMKALRDVGYTSGWGCAEVPGGDRDRLADIAKRMDNVFGM